MAILQMRAAHYVPDATVLDVDLWRFEAALDDAAHATEPEAVSAALRRSLDAYGGDFCPGTDYLWSEPAREDLHRRALDATLRLAELDEAQSRPDDAIATLERAIVLDPMCEEATRRLIALYGRLGRIDAALRAGEVLKGRLAESDLDPEPATGALLVELRHRQEAIARRRARNADTEGEA